MSNKNNHMGSRKSSHIKFRYAVFLAAAFFLIFGSGIFLIIMNNQVIAMGRAGFIRDAAFRIFLGVAAAAVSVICAKDLFKGKRSAKGICGRILAVLICLPAAFFLIRPVVLDIPYLNDPQITYINRLEFDDDLTGDGPARYYLRGTGIDGSSHSFSVNRAEYDAGKNLRSENPRLQAKVTYLPHTDVVLSLRYMPALDEQSQKLFPPSDALPDDWKSFALQINDKVYTLPLPLSVFLKDGWKTDEESSGLMLPGADEPYESYSSQSIRLTNEQGQRINVTVYNTTEQTIGISHCTVGSIYAIYGNLDFAGTQLRLPGGLMPGWSTWDDVLEQYGQPDERFEGYSLTYRADSPSSAYWNLYFDESGYLDEVMVRCQAYSRDH